MIEKEWGRETNNLFREVRNRHYGRQDNFALAQIAILKVIQAFRGILPEEKVLEAIEGARTPISSTRL